MGKRWARLAATLIVVCLCLPAAAAGAVFRPRIGPAMGIVPHAGEDIAAGPRVPVVYHGGSVMTNVTVHTIFWAPPGHGFSGSPGEATPGYESMIQQFFTDAAHDSGSTSNEFSLLFQYPRRPGPGSYSIAYDPALDSIDATDPLPPRSKQCPSPSGITDCVTDRQLRGEIQKLIDARDPGGRGLHDLWFIFLPPDVDTCVSSDSCGSNDFSGYHSLDGGPHGFTIYAVVVDPLLSGPTSPGADPEGNPDAESSIDTSAHEMVESITNPEGVGWMDPNGFEVADKCETPDEGAPIGFAADGSPYNQVINGHQYLIQEMWSNATRGCEQSSSTMTSPLPLAIVRLRQFSPTINGNIGRASAGVAVTAGLLRAGRLVAAGATRTRAGGGWGPLSLRSATGALHGLGDDREVVIVRYGSGGPRPDAIATGDGGNPFTESGWTGWFDLDHGFAVRHHAVAIAPCGQTGVLAITVNGKPSPPAVDRCDTETDAATVPTATVSAGSRVQMTSEDNRAGTTLNPNGALVQLTVPLGEPDSVSSVFNDQVLISPTGFPSCVAELRLQAVRCSGLVRGRRYRLRRRRGGAVASSRASFSGVAAFPRFKGARAIAAGDMLALTNAGHRTLTVLHVARLRVDIAGDQTVLSGGTCQPGEYYGRPISSVPVGFEVGFGLAGAGRVCSADGSAKGLPDSDIAQTDDLSGGQTAVVLPRLEHTTPLDGETLYGRFIALARGVLPGAHASTYTTGDPVSLTIMTSGSDHVVFHAGNVNTAHGVAVRALARGAYVARWILRDANGDTRTVRTAFVEAG